MWFPQLQHIYCFQPLSVWISSNLWLDCHHPALTVAGNVCCVLLVTTVSIQPWMDHPALHTPFSLEYHHRNVWTVFISVLLHMYMDRGRTLSCSSRVYMKPATMQSKYSVSIYITCAQVCYRQCLYYVDACDHRILLVSIQPWLVRIVENFIMQYLKVVISPNSVSIHLSPDISCAQVY